MQGGRHDVCAEEDDMRIRIVRNVRISQSCSFFLNIVQTPLTHPPFLLNIW